MLQEQHIERWLNVAIEPNKGMYLRIKRLLDIVLSVAFLTLLALPMLLIALAIRLDSPGPVFYRQTRIGQNLRRRDRRSRQHTGVGSTPNRRAGSDRRKEDNGGKPFTFFKFRTMCNGADSQVLHREFVQAFIHNQISNAGTAETEKVHCFKMTRDPRVTRVGRFLRKTSLDELPQLFNILKGDMSFVGPRPPLPYEVREYQGWHRLRMNTIPGLTGWWQVCGRSRVSFDKMVQMDLYYIEHRSIALDLKIMALTPMAMLKGAA